MPVLDSLTQKGWKAELTLVLGYIAPLFTCLPSVTHLNSNNLIAGVEPTTSRSSVWRQGVTSSLFQGASVWRTDGRTTQRCR